MADIFCVNRVSLSQLCCLISCIRLIESFNWLSELDEFACLKGSWKSICPLSDQNLKLLFPSVRFGCFHSHCSVCRFYSVEKQIKCIFADLANSKRLQNARCHGDSQYKSVFSENFSQRELNYRGVQLELAARSHKTQPCTTGCAVHEVHGLKQRL